MRPFSAYINIFPLSRRPIDRIIDDIIHDVRSPGLEVRVGFLSVTVLGDDIDVLNAVGTGLRAADDRGDAVLVATVSNA